MEWLAFWWEERNRSEVEPGRCGGAPWAPSPWSTLLWDTVGPLIQEGDGQRSGGSTDPSGLSGLSPAAESLLLEALAAGTSRAYQGSWKQWCMFCETRAADPFLTGQTRAEVRRDEGLVVEFMAYLAVNLQRAPSTVRQKLFAITFVHTKTGLEDPLAKMPRVWLAMKGISRMRGPGPRKLPTTPQMLLWLLARLDDRRWGIYSCLVVYLYVNKYTSIVFAAPCDHHHLYHE